MSIEQERAVAEEIERRLKEGPWRSPAVRFMGSAHNGGHPALIVAVGEGAQRTDFVLTVRDWNELLKENGR